ncbi:hypothetical protein BDN72DRAFT_851100 [Pluteus cervinus]|uniref:Uncharacterized protein n=1 Tax=Pluteus cervinus TaxID=181527 RepID=A0ACD3A2F5_9AGAR|nr:hypothetical protein BDN72DRAFT_851100 [Pluteus cervinus]
MLWMNDHSGLVAEVVDTLLSSPIHTLRLYSRRAILWTELDQGLRRSLLGLLGNPSLRHVSLNGLHIPEHFFSDFSSLKSVELRSLEFRVESSDITPVTGLPQISQLTYYVPRDFRLITHSRIHCIGPTIGLDLSSLQSNLDLDLSQISRLGHLFQLPKLAQLKVSTFPYASGDPWHPMPVQTLDLSGLPSLTNLALCNNDFDSGSNQFEWVGNALESLTAAQRRRLESMTMILITTSDSVAKAATLDLMTPLAPHLSRLYQRSDGIKTILVHLKIAWGNDPNVVSLAQETILRHLSADWNGRKDVLKAEAENDLEWLYRNRSAW